MSYLLPSSSMYVCNECGYWSSTKLGKCPSCGEFGTFSKVQWVSSTWASKNKRSTKWTALEVTTRKDITRPVSSPEIQRIFATWIKQSAAYLLAWEPWVGKSTFVLQLIADLLKATPTLKIAYVTWEETTTQVSERVDRVMWAEYAGQFDLFQSWSTEDIAATIIDWSYDCVIIDSIQTISSARSDSAPWSPSQVRISCDALNHASKSAWTTLFVIWHITKWGEVAWPKYLEHIVDAVLYIEGERNGQFRFIRYKKNRFWSADDMGVFEMTNEWLTPVYNLKERILNDSTLHEWPGSVLWVGIDSWRSVLVHVESLLSKSKWKFPQKTVLGISGNRIPIIVAVLEQYLNLKLGYSDIFVNIPGEFTFRDSGLDLAIAASLWSQSTSTTIGHDIIFIWELWLWGQVLPAKWSAKRANEVQGFTVIDHTRITHISQLPTVL